VDSIKISKFPVNGKDLINIGADTRFIGLYMDVLKKEWFDSGCTLSKKELLQKYINEFQSVFKESI